MQKLFSIVVALASAGCAVHGDESNSASMPTQEQAVKRDCIRIVRTEIGNIAEQNSPIFKRSLDACNNATGHYNNEYVICIQQSPYVTTLDCAYKARGIDRSRSESHFAGIKSGEDGGFSGSTKEMLAAVYKDADPKSSIDALTVNSYLERRDTFRDIARLPRINDSHLPINVSNSNFQQDGITYWIVRHMYQELQLAKVMREDRHGAQIVFCAQYGSMDVKLVLNSGFCAVLLKKYLQVESPSA